MFKAPWLTSKKPPQKTLILALFSYMGVLCLVPLLFNRDNAYVQFHARQGLVLWIWGVLAIFSLYVPILGGFIFSFSVLVIMLYSVLGIVSVLFARSWKLPVISLFAEKL